MKKCNALTLVLALLLLATAPGKASLHLTSPSNVSGDYFSWEHRTDRHEKPAGIFEITPFPVTEENTIDNSYSIKNDEFPTGKTYYLGTKYYVDGGFTSGGSDGSWEHPWTTISDALDAVEGGKNITIIVRGMHDDFNGEYSETGLLLKSGRDDTHRFMIVGYGQERPVINGVSTVQDTIGAGTDVAYATVQRLKIQDNYRNGIRTGPDDAYLNVIDVWLYNNNTYHFEDGRLYADGNLYFLSSDNCWIFHTTSEHTYGHGFKVGDDAHNNILEWSMAKEIGYWDGFPFAEYYNSSASGIDFPNDLGDSDGNGTPDRGWNNIIRYNIVDTVLYIGVQIRRCPNFSFHHNEVFNTCKFDDVDMSTKGITRKQVAVISEDTFGEIYANVIRDPGSRDTSGLAINSCQNENEQQEIIVYGNLIYGGKRTQGNLEYGGVDATGIVVGGNTGTVIFLYNNSIYANAESNLILSPNSQPVNSNLILKNNILYQAGSGSCMEFNGYADWSIHDHNLYYAPSGSIGATLDGTEIGADPRWLAIPEGEYSPSKAALMASSPAVDKGIDLSAQGFDMDLAGVYRPQGMNWDIGAYEFAAALVLYGQPANQAIHLTWDFNASPTFTGTWQIDYFTTTVTAPFTIPNLPSSIRSTVLTENVQNHQWYTVTLNALLEGTPILSDTVRVMPTDRSLYLPLVLAVP